MAEWLDRYAALIGGTAALELQEIQWSPDAWLEVPAPAPGAIGHLKSTAPKALRRSDVRSLWQEAGPRPGFIAAMAWGFGSTSYGPARLRQMLQRPRSITSPESVIENIAVVAHIDGAAAGFSALWSHGRSRVYGLGTAFGTKALYFAATPDTPGPPPLVLDQFVFKGAKALTDAGILDANPVPDPRKCLTGPRYAAYCEWASTQCPSHPDLVELVLFKLGKGTLSITDGRW